MPRVPLLSGTRLVLANAPEHAVVLRPPPPRDGVADVASAVRDALRFPLEGEGIEALELADRRRDREPARVVLRARDGQ